jgi:hypothetical protein
MPEPKIHSGHIEVAVADLIGYRTHTIAPNISWGWQLRHEADLICVNQNRFVTEIEIKISAADLRADFGKKHGHQHKKIHRLVYAIPQGLLELCQKLAHPEAGIITVNWSGYRFVAKWERQGKKNKNPPITEKQHNELLRLAAMRIWSLKEHNNRIKK